MSELIDKGNLDFASVLRGDPAVQEKLRALVMDSLDEAHDLIVNGSPQVKREVMKTVVPELMRALNAHEGEDELADMRAEMQSLMTDTRNSQRLRVVE